MSYFCNGKLPLRNRYSLKNLFHSKEDETYYYILSLICSPVKGSEAFINLSSPSKTLDGGKELEKEMLSPKEKTPRGQLEDVLPDAPPAPRDHRPRSSEVTMLPPTEEEPRRSSRKVIMVSRSSAFILGKGSFWSVIVCWL